MVTGSLIDETGAALLLVACFGVLAVAELLVRRTDDDRTGDTAGRAVTNFGLGIVAMTVSSLPLVSRLGASALGTEYGFGLARAWGLGWPAMFGVTMLLRSLTTYWVHRLMHRVPLLWRVHRTHHADAHLDISTGLRNHPLELVMTLPVGAAVILLVGAPASVVIAVDTILFVAALWQHAEFALPAGIERSLGRLFVTPAFHRVHHLPDRTAMTAITAIS